MARPRGSLSERTIRIQQFCREICDDPDYREAILVRARTNQLGTMEPVIWAYAYGKPKETVDLRVGRIEDESLVGATTEALAQRAEELLRRLHEAQDAEAALHAKSDEQALLPEAHGAESAPVEQEDVA